MISEIIKAILGHSNTFDQNLSAEAVKFREQCLKMEI